MATKEELLKELASVRARLEDAEETLRAIRHGEVDALLVSGPEGEQVFTLKGVDHSYRILVESINEGAATLAGDGKIFYANRRLAEILQLPLEKVVTASICDYIEPLDRPMFEALLARGKEGASTGEVRLLTADGAVVPAYLSLSGMQLEALPDMVCLVLTDLTQQKRDEALLAEGRLSQEILSQSEQPIAVIDDSGLIIRASRGLHQYCDFNPLLQPFEQAFPLCFNSSEPFSPEAIKECKILHNEEMHFFRRDGSQVFLLVNAGPLLGEHQEIQGCVIVFTDITERKQQEVERQKLLEQQQAFAEELASTNEELQVQAEELVVQKEELEKLNTELKEANEEMEAFSYSVSHDLKTPVRAIEGFSRMLMGEHADKLDAEGLRLLKVITTNTKLMQHLIDDLLALSRLGRMQVKKSVINLSLMARQIFEVLRSQEPKRDVRLMVEELPPAMGDQSLLYQVMQNLMSNSMKYTKPKNPALIEVGGREGKKETVYYVRDNGVGFDERYLRNLFRPFQRLHGGEEYEGTGVGLAIVKRIIQRHGGRVWAEGKVDSGATFYFSLPKNGG